MASCRASGAGRPAKASAGWMSGEQECWSGRLFRRPSSPVAKHGVRRVGMVTAASRTLPDYLVAGTKKGGTTSLANWLVQHPGVMRMFPKAQRHKSAHYFDTNFANGLPWYRSHFPTESARARLEATLGLPTGGG